MASQRGFFLGVPEPGDPNGIGPGLGSCEQSGSRLRLWPRGELRGPRGLTGRHDPAPDQRGHRRGAQPRRRPGRPWPRDAAENVRVDSDALPGHPQYTRGTILHFTFAVYRSHSSPYFARQTLSSSAWRVSMSAT
jgi:hypothetical protein